MTRKEQDEVKLKKKQIYKAFDKFMKVFMVIAVLVGVLIGGYLAYKDYKPIQLSEEEIEEMVTIAKNVNENGLKSVSDEIRDKYKITITGEQFEVSTFKFSKEYVRISFINDQSEPEIIDGITVYDRTLNIIALALVGGVLSWVVSVVISFVIAIILDIIVEKIIFRVDK